MSKDRSRQLGEEIVENLKRNVRLDMRPDILHSDKSYLLPNVVDFDELFTITGESQRWPFNATKKDTMKIGSWLSLRGGENNRHQNFEVKPTAQVMRVIRENMIDLGSRDEVYFQIIIHDNGWALVISQYNLIIGNRWVAYIDANTLPPEITEAQT